MKGRTIANGIALGQNEITPKNERESENHKKAIKIIKEDKYWKKATAKLFLNSR